MSSVIAASDFDLPWVVSTEEQRRIRSITGTFLGLVLILGLGIPLITLPELQREQLEKLPPQLAQLVMAKPEVVIPPASEPIVENIPDVEPVVNKEQKTPIAKEQPSVADAREKAQISGLLAFQDAFADMRDAVDVSKLRDTAALQQGEGEAASLDRSLIRSKQNSRSTGVDVSALSKTTGGVALSGRATTKVEAPENAKGSGGNRSRKSLDLRERSIEDIRRVFDANKGAIFAIYNRALRSDPGLQGQVVLELIIDSVGAVVECNVQSSELEDETLVAKIVSRVRMFDFGKKDVAQTRINYPVHFLPS